MDWGRSAACPRPGYASMLLLLFQLYTRNFAVRALIYGRHCPTSNRIRWETRDEVPLVILTSAPRSTLPPDQHNRYKLQAHRQNNNNNNNKSCWWFWRNACKIDLRASSVWISRFAILESRPSKQKGNGKNGLVLFWVD